MNELEELRDLVKQKKEKKLAGLRENYRYAKSLGFTVEEAQTLCHWTKVKIDRINALKEKG